MASVSECYLFLSNTIKYNNIIWALPAEKSGRAVRSRFFIAGQKAIYKKSSTAIPHATSILFNFRLKITKTTDETL